jgi:hypothetical protein
MENATTTLQQENADLKCVENIDDLKFQRDIILDYIEDNTELPTKVVMLKMVEIISDEDFDNLLTEELMDEAIEACENQERSKPNDHALWGGKYSKYDTQADYQRACLGGKFN